MATILSRIDRKTVTYDLSAATREAAAAIPPDLMGVDVALLPPRSKPTAVTVWTAAVYAAGSFTVAYAGPDADPTGRLVVPATSDLWMRISDNGDVDAEFVERITIQGGGAPLAAVPASAVLSVNGKTGTAVVLTPGDVGAQAAGDYATNTALTTGLAGKLGATAGAGGALSGNYPNPGLNETTVDNIVAADIGNPATATGAAARAAFAARGESAQMLHAALPNLTSAVRGYNDATDPVLRIIDFGNSVANGDTLPTPATQAPGPRFVARLGQTVNQLGNLNIVRTDGTVDGTIVTDFNNTHYAAGKTAAGGSPTVALLVYGMNDGMPAQYHAGQTLPGLYAAMRAAIIAVLNDGGDPIVFTTPHPHTGRTPWTNAVGSPSYPTATPDPALTAEASVKTADWLGNGLPVAASYRHIRANQAMRQAATELGVPVIDAERYWFEAVATHGEDALFNTGEYAHPNLLGHQESYWKAIDAFMRGLQAPPVSASVPRPRTEVLVVKATNAARTSTTTLSNDDQLLFPVGANQVWHVEVDLYFTGSAGDLRVGFSTPAGTTGSMGVVGPGLNATDWNNHNATARRVAVTDTYGLPVGGNGADAAARVSAIVRTTTAGTVTMQFCQDTSSASTTTVYADSLLRATRIA